MSMLYKKPKGLKGLLVLYILFFTGIAAFGQNHLIYPPELCNYFPTDALFKAGATRVFPVVVSSGPIVSGTTEAYEIRLPNVKKQMTTYYEVQLKKDDELLIDACGCVQTGGKGKTWKRYVDPSGPNSGELYHGLIWIANPSAYNLPVSKINKNLVRIEDVIKAQNKGIKIKVLKNSYLILGYEDDNYSDNGYWGHDNGTNDQCKDIGGAMVRITIYRH